MKKFIVLIMLLLSLYGCSNSRRASLIFDKVIFIDPGHGGLDNGCAYENIYEDEINLKIATYLYEKLIDNNIIAYITRTGDYDLASANSKNRKNEDLKNRVLAIEKSHCDIFISLHLNYYSSSSVYGPMVYYKHSNQKSYELANIIQNNLNNLVQKKKVCHYDNFYLFRKTSMPGVLIECGFLSNFNERNRLIKASYQKQIANCIFDSIEQFFAV